MKIKILTFLITFTVGALAWLPFKPAPPVQRHMLVLPPDIPVPMHLDFHVFQGRVGGREAELHLNREGNRLVGYYSIWNTDTSFPVRGLIDEDNCVLLAEYALPGGTPTGWFRGEMRQERADFSLSLVGSWSHWEDGTDPGTFQFEEIRPFTYRPAE